VEQTVSSFLKALQIPISEKYIQKLILAHPDFPSLVSISDTLKRLGIDNIARRVDSTDLKELPYPYLLRLDKGQGDMLLIKSENDLVKYKSDLEQWGAIVLQAEPIEMLRDRLSNVIYNREIRIRNCSIALLTTIVSIIALLCLDAFSWLSFVLLVTSLTGAIIGFFLLAKELGVTYQSIEAFCNAGKNLNCDKVIGSEINLFGVKFPEIAIMYFIFQVIISCLATWFSELKDNLIQALAWLSTLTLPVILFSLHYQYRVVKTWCKLCLAVVGVLLLQFILFAMGYFNGTVQLWANLSPFRITVLALSLVGIGFSVIIIKAIIERLNELQHVGTPGDKVKNSSSVFHFLLKQQKKIDATPFEREIQVGDPCAPVKIIMVSNLYCAPCKLKHDVVVQLVSSYKDKVSVAMRFVPSEKHPGAVRSLLSYWSQFIRGKPDETERTMEFIHEWYAIWDLEKFIRRYPAQFNNTEIDEMELKNYAWVNEMAVSVTPTFFVNGYELPREYMIEDLLALAPALAESSSKETKLELMYKEV
jgi:uncharacterized membrane protein